MLLPQPLSRGRLLRRYKRFLADIAFDDGREETVHTPNPGAMLGLATPGITVWTSKGLSPGRKLARTWELVQAEGALVGVNTLNANRLVAEALARSRIAELAGYAEAQREVNFAGHGRVDFRLRAPERAPVWLEVKSVTLSRTTGLAEWPDCPSARGADICTPSRPGLRRASVRCCCSWCSGRIATGSPWPPIWILRSPPDWTTR